jgi:hypothetical protein
MLVDSSFFHPCHHLLRIILGLVINPVIVYEFVSCNIFGMANIIRNPLSTSRRTMKVPCDVGKLQHVTLHYMNRMQDYVTVDLRHV